MAEKKVKIGVEKHIRIVDNEIAAQIDRIMELPKYKKNFNGVVNDALFYGLPILCEKLFGQVTLQTEEVPPSAREVNPLEDRHFQTMIRLLKEAVLNVTINKSILSSIYHDLERVNNVLLLDNAPYKQGLFGDTPDYLYDYEMSGLKKLRR